MKTKTTDEKPLLFVSDKLQYHFIKEELSKKFTVKVNKSKNEVADVIFPRSFLGFIIKNARDFGIDDISDENFFEDFERLKNSYKHGFCILMISEDSIKNFKNIQLKSNNFFSLINVFRSPIQIFPASNFISAVNTMINISSYQEQKKFQETKTQEIETMCRNMDQMGSFIFQGIGGIDNEQDIPPVIQGMKSCSNIIQSNINQLCENTPLEKKKAEILFKLFSK
eukprot:gene12255-5840_t